MGGGGRPGGTPAELLDHLGFSEPRPQPWIGPRLPPTHPPLQLPTSSTPELRRWVNSCIHSASQPASRDRSPVPRPGGGAVGQGRVQRGPGCSGVLQSLTRAQDGRPEGFIVLDAGLVVGVSLLALHQEGAGHGQRAPRTCKGRGERGEEDSLPLPSESTAPQSSCPPKPCERDLF